MDDAILSCGGQIASLVEDEQFVSVLTIFAKSAPSLLSDGAKSAHQLWGDPPNVTKLRRAEDLAACTRAGADVHFAEFTEALYRQGKNGQ